MSRDGASIQARETMPNRGGSSRIGSEDEMDSPHDARRLLDRTKDFLSSLGRGLGRILQVSRLRVEMAALRRSLDRVTRDVGRKALESLRKSGTMSAADVAALLRRADDLDDQLAAKGRRIADLEREDAASGDTRVEAARPPQA